MAQYTLKQQLNYVNSTNYLIDSISHPILTDAQKLNLPFGTNQVIKFTYSKAENDNIYTIDIRDNTLGNSALAHIVLNYDVNDNVKYIDSLVIQTPGYVNSSDNLENITNFKFKEYTGGNNKSQITDITTPDDKNIYYDYSDDGYITDITDEYGNKKHLDYVEQEYNQGVEHIHQDGDKYGHNIDVTSYVISKETNTSSSGNVYLVKTYDIAHNAPKNNFLGPDLHQFDVEHNYLISRVAYTYGILEMPIASYWLDPLFRTDSADTEEHSFHTVASEIATQTFTNSVTTQTSDSQVSIKTEKTYDALARLVNLKKYEIFSDSESKLTSVR